MCDNKECNQGNSKLINIFIVDKDGNYVEVEKDDLTFINDKDEDGYTHTFTIKTK